MWLRLELCAGHLSSSIPNLASHVFMDLALCKELPSCWDMFGLLVPVKGGHPIHNCVSTLWLQFGIVASVQILLATWYFSIPKSWNKGPSHKVVHLILYVLKYTKHSHLPIQWQHEVMIIWIQRSKHPLLSQTKWWKIFHLMQTLKAVKLICSKWLLILCYGKPWEQIVHCMPNCNQ